MVFDDRPLFCGQAGELENEGVDCGFQTDRPAVLDKTAQPSKTPLRARRTIVSRIRQRRVPLGAICFAGCRQPLHDDVGRLRYGRLRHPS